MAFGTRGFPRVTRPRAPASKASLRHPNIKSRSVSSRGSEHTVLNRGNARNAEDKMGQGRLKVFGWGREGEGLTEEEEAFILERYSTRFGTKNFDEVRAKPLSEVELRSPR